MLELRVAMECGIMLPDGGHEITSKYIIWNRAMSLQKHSVEHCTCSFCHPWSLSSCRPLPLPGRFGVEVPPADNKWKWTRFTLRLGKWRYWLSLGAQLFPSRRPFFKAERW